MKSLTAYLMFDGNLREAMTFYAKCLGAELMLSPMPEAPGVPPSDRIMHARTDQGPPDSDGLRLDARALSVAIEYESSEEVDSLFAALGEGGEVTMPVSDTFWNARFGTLKDKFGIEWMFNFEKPRS